MNDQPDPAGGERFSVLFVCSGNTCRSPLAEAIARTAVAARGWEHVEVASAGASTAPGLPASDGARRVARRHGLDLEDHSSRPLDDSMLERADLVLAMGPHHASTVRHLGGGGKVALLAAFAAGEEGEGPEWAVEDPFGGDDEVYEEVFRLLAGLVEGALRRLEPILAP